MPSVLASAACPALARSLRVTPGLNAPRPDTRRKPRRSASPRSRRGNRESRGFRSDATPGPRKSRQSRCFSRRTGRATSPAPSSRWTAPPRQRSSREMGYRDLRDFLSQLEHAGELKRVRAEVDPKLEMTEVCDRVLKAGGPALLFEKPKGYAIPVLGNLFGTIRRVALAMGAEAGADPREALRG